MGEGQAKVQSKSIGAIRVAKEVTTAAKEQEPKGTSDLHIKGGVRMHLVSQSVHTYTVSVISIKT